MKLSSLVQLCFAGVALVGVPQTATAFQKSTGAVPPDFDRRLTAGRPPALPADKLAAWESFRRQFPTARVDFDQLLGTPKFVAAHDRCLTPPASQGQSFAAAPDTKSVASAFLRQHQDLFGHGPEVLEQARLARDYATPHNGLRTVVWEQQVDGIALFEAVLIANVYQQRRVGQSIQSVRVRAGSRGGPRPPREEDPAAVARDLGGGGAPPEREHGGRRG